MPDIARRVRRFAVVQALSVLGLGVVLCPLAERAEAAPRRAAQSLDVSPDDAEFPLPPIPPLDVPAYSAAPMPNSAIGSYEDPAAAPSKGAKITPGFYHPKDYNIGEGYLSGSTVAGEQERRAQPVPRLQLKMPLQ